ncbi:MAG: hypothetical protein HQ519_09195 [Planctomycetes bacterium]|nr:hypothetical protein [Planctomycetota bacterium]
MPSSTALGLGFFASTLFANFAVAQTTVLSEDFRSGTFPPVGWAEINNGISLGWEDDVTEYAFHDDFHGANDNHLLSPVMDLSALTVCYLHAVQELTFAQYMDTCTVDVSLDGGVSFTQVYLETSAVDGAQILEADLSAFAGLASVQISFHYVGDFANEWRIDELTVDDLPYEEPLYWPELPTVFAPAGNFWETFDSFSGSVPPHLAINRLNNVTRDFDPDAWCNIGQLGPCILAHSGQFCLEMGLDPAGTQFHEVSNALIIGLNGTGVTNFVLGFQALHWGEEPHPDDGLFLSEDGANWVPLLQDWEYLIGSGNIGTWEPMVVDLSSTSVDVSGLFYLAFAQADDYPYGGLDGVAIDDVVIGTLPPLLYNVQNLVAGQQATFSVTGAQSTSLLILAYSTTGGGPSNTIFGLAQMSDPIFQIGRYSPDGAGNISLMLNIPPNSVGIPLWTQALEITNYGAGIFSNALALVVQ